MVFLLGRAWRRLYTGTYIQCLAAIFHTLFDKERVSAVVHHGGAGTTAIEFAEGRPIVVVP
jgi:hypothetical protein